MINGRGRASALPKENNHRITRHQSQGGSVFDEEDEGRREEGHRPWRNSGQGYIVQLQDGRATQEHGAVSSREKLLQ